MKWQDKYTKVLGLVLLGIAAVDLKVPCPFYALTGLFCPGCGTGRMLRSLLKLQFKQAFLYQPVVLCSLPIIVMDIFNGVQGKSKLVSRILNVLNVACIIALYILCIVRNLQ